MALRKYKKFLFGSRLRLPAFTRYFYQNNEEHNLNQSNVDSSVERVANNNSINKSDHLKVHKILYDKFFVLAIAWFDNSSKPAETGEKTTGNCSMYHSSCLCWFNDI